MSEKFVDFRIIKQRVSIEEVLGHYSIQLRRANKSGSRGKCPLPTHSSKTSGESFSVALDRNIWACQSSSCAATRQGKKGGNVIDLVAVMEACSIRDAALKLDEWFLSSTDTRPEGKRGDQRTELVALKSNEQRESVGNTPLTFSLKGIDPTHPYFESRGITKETAECFGAGFFPGRGSMSGRVVIPISNENGELVAYAGRAVDDAEPKYKLPSGFRKSEVLWNLDRVRGLSAESEPVIVVEGFFDCMKVQQSGFSNVVALMGSSMSEAQQKLLIDFKRIVLLLDGDEAGESASNTIASALVSHTFVKALRLGREQQPDQLSSDQIQAALADL